MTITVYVDGAGGKNSGFGYYVKETGQSAYHAEPGITNNQAEYRAVLAALEELPGHSDMTIYSDSQVIVRQLNHQYAIKNNTLRTLARSIWLIMAEHDNISIHWIPRGENLAGKMLG